MTEEKPVKLIYIAGYGRSGTTLLDIAVGQQEGVLAAGELTVLARHAWENGEYCACRKRVRDCEFWAAVVDDWQAARSSSAMRDYGRLLARSEWLFNTRRFLARLFPQAISREYVTETRDMLRAIARTSKARVILDSSKLPGRAASLMTIQGVEIYLVHVVRDGRGVGWSMQKPYERQVEAGIQKELKPKPLWYTAARWVIVNLAVELLRWRLPDERSIRLRYEDFVEDPETAVANIMALVGKDYQRPSCGGDVLKPQHQVAGSRHRMQEEIRISKDIGWKSRMPRGKQVVFSVLAAPLLWRYGYLGNTSDGKPSGSDESTPLERAA